MFGIHIMQIYSLIRLSLKITDKIIKPISFDRLVHIIEYDREIFADKS